MTHWKKTLLLGKTEGRRRRGRQRMRCLDGITNSMDMSLSKLWEDEQALGDGSWWWTRKPGVLQSMGLQRVGNNLATELNWTELNVEKGTVKEVVLTTVILSSPFFIVCLMNHVANEPVVWIMLHSLGKWESVSCSVLSDSLQHHGL